MGLSVVVVDGGDRLGGGGSVDDLANRYLGHLASPGGCGPTTTPATTAPRKAPP